MHLSALRWLSRLHDTVGATGLAAAAALPGLSAMLDQHAAAVRDATLAGDTPAIAGVVLLANYGHGVLHYAREHRWQPPPAALEAWGRADWTSLRLTAVCALARTGPPRP
jgi:Family of unknown function (DUF6401)